jgi:hypothetical protein
MSWAVHTSETQQGAAAASIHWRLSCCMMLQCLQRPHEPASSLHSMPPAGPLAHACTCICHVRPACLDALLHPNRALEHKTVKMSHAEPPSGTNTHPAIPTTIQNSHTGTPAGQHSKTAAAPHTPNTHQCTMGLPAYARTKHKRAARRSFVITTRGTTAQKRKKGGLTVTGNALQSANVRQ